MSANNPLDYQPPPVPDRASTGWNFALGVVTGIVASGVAGSIAWSTQDGSVLLIALVVLLVGKIGVAAYFAGNHRKPGFAPGLLMSIGLVCLVLGGLCFAALKNI